MTAIQPIFFTWPSSNSGHSFKVSEIYKATGDNASEEDLILLLENDKVTIEITSACNGTVTLLKQKGDIVNNGELLGYFNDASSENEIIKKLQEEIADLKLKISNNNSEQSPPKSSDNNSLSKIFASVYLTDNAPSWLISAAQKAFRTRYHPDKWNTVEAKEKAARVFKAAENAFEKIITPK